MLKKVFFAFIFICAFFVYEQAYAATIYSNSSTGNDTTGDGSSSLPYKTFHKAYTSASSGDTLNLTGTFTWTDVDETGDSSNTGYSIAKNIIIQGQSADTTIIQAASSENSADRRVFTIPVANTVTINDVYIRYGKVTSDGGGIDVYGIATIDSSNIRYNRATDGSGGGVSVHGALTISNSNISNNIAHYQGGGLVRHYYDGTGSGTPDDSDTLDIINSTISSNQVTQTVAYLEGGGVFYRRGKGSITNSTITLNQVVNGGTNRSTHGLGSGDSSVVVQLKNNIIAGNILSTNGGDIGHRSTSNGTFTDNGGNIIGRPGYYRDGYSFASTSWADSTSYNTAIDGTYVLQDGEASTSGSLYLDSALADNDTEYGTQTFSITDENSIAVDNAQTGINGSVNVPTVDQRGVSREGSPDIGAYELLSDTDAPIISSVASSASTTSATITWTTDEASSSIVQYGPTTNYGTTTSETDTSPRITSHSVDLSSLPVCSIVHYRVKSIDASSNIGTGDDNIFTTSGCTASSDISNSSYGGLIEIASGGTVSLFSNSIGLALSVPVSFAGSDASFQIKELVRSIVVDSIGAPSGRMSTQNHIYELTALTSSLSSVTSFDNAITLTLTYSDEEISGLDESSLKIYRWDGSSWNMLSDCTVNTNANSVTCTTTNFSTFGLFGNQIVASSSGSLPILGCKDKNAKNYNYFSKHTPALCKYENTPTLLVQKEPVEDTLIQKEKIESIQNDEIKLVGDFSVLQNIGKMKTLYRVGSKGETVSKIQEALNQIMNANLNVDGIFGKKTEQAVKNFQTKYNLDADGLVGTQTANKILSFNF